MCVLCTCMAIIQVLIKFSSILLILSFNNANPLRAIFQSVVLLEC